MTYHFAHMDIRRWYSVYTPRRLRGRKCLDLAEILRFDIRVVGNMYIYTY